MNSAEGYMQDCIHAYGHDVAFELNTAIVNSLNDTLQRLPLLRPVTGIIPAIIRRPSIPIGGGGFALKDGSIILFFHEDDDPADIIDDIPRLVEHEVAHVAHRQHNARFMLDNNQLLFAASMAEGIALYAEESLDPDYDVMQIALPDTDNRLMMDDLIDLIYNPGNNQGARYYDYLMGNDAYSHRGYEIGHFVVASYVAHTGLSLEQLMKSSVKTLREFAETVI